MIVIEGMYAMRSEDKGNDATQDMAASEMHLTTLLEGTGAPLANYVGGRTAKDVSTWEGVLNNCGVGDRHDN